MGRQQLQTALKIDVRTPPANCVSLASSVEETGAARARVPDTASWSWAVVSIPVVAWEIFLRVDSQVMTLQTKLWFFALLASAVVTLASLVGRVFGRVTTALAGERIAARLQLGVLVLFAASAGAAEYVGVTYYHSPELLQYWPVPAIVGMAVALATHYLTRKVVAARASVQVSMSRARTWAFPVSVAVLVTLAAVAVMGRPDIAACVVRPNTLIGRVVGTAFRPFASRLRPTTASTPKPPDLPSVRKFPPGNVILISIDALRADFVGAFNTEAARTPRLKELAERSVVFENAFASRPQSAPSMASILTGLYPANHRVRENAVALPEDVTTLAEMLAGEGYATAGFVSNINFSRTFNFQQGFDVYEYLEPALDADGLITDSSDPEAVDAALTWAEKHTGNKIFLWAHLNAPHSPYLPPADLRPELQPGRGAWFDVLNMPAPLARVEGLRTYFDRNVYLKLYEAEVASVDSLVGRLMDGLNKLGMLDDAQVIFLADHGEAFGEADDFGHGGSLHPAETRVPLMWRLPGDVRGGERVTTAVQLVDLVPTLQDLTGRDPLPMRDGRILSGILLGEVPQDDGFAFSEAGWAGALGAQDVKYAGRTRQRAVWLGDGFPLVLNFDRTTDPMENHWRRYDPSPDDQLFNLLEHLAVEAAREHSHQAAPVLLNQSQKERLRALGYLSPGG